jgi:hypothetical protein
MFWSGRRSTSIMAAHYRITIYKDNFALLRAVYHMQIRDSETGEITNKCCELTDPGALTHKFRQQ